MMLQKLIALPFLAVLITSLPDDANPCENAGPCQCTYGVTHPTNITNICILPQLVTGLVNTDGCCYLPDIMCPKGPCIFVGAEYKYVNRCGMALVYSNTDPGATIPLPWAHNTTSTTAGGGTVTVDCNKIGNTYIKIVAQANPALIFVDKHEKLTCENDDCNPVQ
jgi:hypothetical protein